jgi:pimeloyl-ACP methyl ester carboxylesterase
MSIPGRMARLARWLGPWAAPEAAPVGITRRSIRVASGPREFEAWVYVDPSRAPQGSVLIMPGLHFAGPADPRFDRLSRVLAATGFVVLSPFLPDYTELLVRPTVLEDAEAALDALLAVPERPSAKPGVFSISFGSLPALRLAARRSKDIGRLVVFGGFSSFHSTLSFALTGDGERKNDPLNSPVVMLNLLPYVEGVSSTDHDLLAQAFRAYCKASWNREESKIPALHRAIAERVAEDLPERLREVFLVSARARPGVEDLAKAAIERAGDQFSWVEPAPHLASIACPVTLVHGREDDVIPFEEGQALERSLAGKDVELILTGLYGHSRGAGMSNTLSRVGENARELAGMTRILSAMARLSGDAV